MTTGPIKSVKSILSGMKTPNAPNPAPMQRETVSKVKVRAGGAPKILSGGGMAMKGC